MARQKVALEIEIIRGGNTRATIDAISKLELELDKLNKQIRLAKKEGRTETYTRLRGETAAVNDNLKQLRKELIQQQKDFRALSFVPGSYEAISREVVKLKREFQSLGKEAREGITGNNLRTRIKSLTGDLKRIDAGVGVYTRNVGNYASAFRGLVPLLGAVGIGFGINELVQQTQRAIKTFSDFQQEIKTLQAISGATGEEMAALERNARSLGAATQFTALEVAQLQTNFARIGLTAPEIIEATEATINLAIATTESVTRASEVVGAAINGFSLAADQSGRVTDVLAESFNRTALSLDKYAEAQKFAATVATAAGVNIEGTAAAMGILADAGLEGSNIGTVLRRVFSDLSTEGSKLSNEIGFVVKDTDDFTRAMELLSEAGIDNSKAFDLVGRVAQSGLLALAARGKDVAQLTRDFEAAGGAAARTAAIVGDTLAQDFLKAKSAIEGLRINVVSLAGDALRGAVQGFTSLVDLLNEFTKIPVSEQLEAERLELNSLVTALTLSNEGEEARSRLITEISVKYPAFLKQVDIETASTEELQAALTEVNQEYKTRILLQKLAEDVEKGRLVLQKRQEALTEKEIEQGDALAKAQDFLGDFTLTRAQALELLNKNEKSRQATGRESIKLYERERQLGDALRASSSDIRVAKNREADATEKLNEAETARARTLENVLRDNPEYAALLDAVKTTTEQTTKATDDATKSNKSLQVQIAELKAELEDVPEGSPMFEQIQDEIAQLEGKLSGSIKNIGDASEKFVAGSLKALQKELTDLNAEIDNAPAGSAAFVQAVAKVEAAQARLNEVLRQRELLTFDVKDFVGDPAEIERNVKALEDALKFEASVKELRIEAGVVDLDSATDAIQRLELQRIASLQKQLRAGVITEEQYQKERARIAQQTEISILQSRLSGFEVGSTGYLQAVQDLADAEIAIEAEKNERIAESANARRDQITNYAFQAADGIADALIQIEQNKLAAELDANITALEEQYARKIELAAGNAELEEELELELETKKAALEKDAARRRKDLAKKEAIVQGALGAIKTVAELGFGNPLVFLALAAQAIQLATQLAVIESQQFGRGGRIGDRMARGGKVRGRSHSQGGEGFTVQSTGQRVELEGDEGVVNKRSMRSRDVLSMTGTPAQIISGVNSYRGYGEAFAPRPVKMAVVKRIPSFQTGGVVPASPQFVNPNTELKGVVALTLSDDQIDRIAERIATKTAKETGQAVEAGMDSANRRKDRNQFVQNKTGIR
jgi:TP901 family phage tail tape measure protein